MPNVNKMSDHPKLLKQLALKVIDGIPLDASKIYTDGNRHPIHLQWAPSHVGLANDLAKAAASDPGDSEDTMVLTTTEIDSRAKEFICRTWVDPPPVHPCRSRCGRTMVSSDPGITGVAAGPSRTTANTDLALPNRSSLRPSVESILRGFNYLERTGDSPLAFD
ncbi:RNase H domain-containing protein [Trichonephila clavipes]|nr:RNase H domain-containing protein [Trichonephila clavipes]